MLQNRVIQNAKWIIVGKAIQALMQLVIGMLSARYLGPSNYGVLNYAASIAAFALPMAQVGMRSTLVQEYISDPEKEGEILGTSIVIGIVSSCFCLVGVNAFVMVANRNDPETILVCALYSITLFFQTAELLQYWFQAKLLARYSSVASLIAYLAISLYRLFLLITGKNIYWFALAHSVEYCCLGILLLISYKKGGGKTLSFSFRKGKEILAKSRYYILADVMVTVFQNTDHIMLQLMAGEEANGFYTAAVTSAGITGFVYNALLDSARPVLLESRRKSAEDFDRKVAGLYALMIYLSLAQSIFFVFLANPIIRILYGKTYLAAVPVLQIVVWMLAFSCMGSVRNIWLLGEEKHDILWIINLSGAAANVLLNALLIPLWGASGAAIASVLTQFMTNFVIGFLAKSLRKNNMLILKGFDPRYIRYLFVQ